MAIQTRLTLTATPGRPYAVFVAKTESITQLGEPRQAFTVIARQRAFEVVPRTRDFEVVDN